jgi:peptidoglycan/LPS O-acetylase OafA/YrhL
MNPTSQRANFGAARLLEVDLLRLVAALMVVFRHYLASDTAESRTSLVFGSIFEWGGWAAALAHFGSLGVDIFFMISGFVIALSAENRSVRHFLASRVARLLPAFWFCCLITWVLIKLDPAYRAVSLSQLFANMFLVARPLGYDFIDGVYWSLVIEVRFYLMIALLMWIFGMKAFPGFLFVWFVVGVADLVFALPSAIRFVAMPQFAPCFVVGGALHLIRQRRVLWLAYGLFAGSLLLACVKSVQRIPVIFDFQVIVVAAILSTAALLMWLFATDRTARFRRPWMALAGSLTFPLYLLHEDLGFMFMRHFPLTGFEQIDNRISITLLALVVFFLASYAVVEIVEKPIAPRLRRWLAGTPSRSSVVASG